MYLKSLTLKGFKSFAQPTTFAFEPGVTCVVGPNGSGKSNVVDALAWVMGEQGVKTLRGGKMEDVIFAGTSTRGPLGRAEVTLSIDNSDGALPIDYTEVTISRTLFRNGASEYAINGRTCRLLDVQELLSDSGLGREMHVIVGQGQLDAVLRASPEDRRGFIEEAAGILKHRRRKEKTLRKLEAMQANLTRLSDLAGEVRRQLKPLGQQAQVARQAQQIAATVRDARARLLADDVVVLRRALDAHGRTESERHSERIVIQEQLDHNQARVRRLEQAQIGDAVDVARRNAFGLESAQERLRGLYTLANQRLALLGTQAEPGERPAGVTPERVAEASAEVDRLRAGIQTAEDAWARARTVTASVRRDLDAVDEEIASQSALVSRHDLQVAQLAGESDTAASRLAAVRGEVLRQQGALDSARERLAASRRHLAEQDDDTDDSESEVDLEEVVELAQAQVAQAEAEVETLREQLHGHEREREALAARTGALSLALGQKDGSAALLDANLPGILGLVAEVMSVQPGFERAIAAALGTLADAVAADGRDAAVAAVSHAEHLHLGRIELVITDAVTANSAPAPEPAGVADLSDLPGATLARTVVDAPAGVLGLLAGTVIVDDLAAAVALADAGGAATPSTIITRAGDVLTAHSLRGGSGAAPSKLELVTERDTAENRLAEVTSLIERVAGDLGVQRELLTTAREQVRAAQAALREQSSRQSARAERLSRLTVQVDAATAEFDRLSAAAELAAAGIAEAEAAAATAAAALHTMRSQPRPILDVTARDSLFTELEAAREAEIEARLRVDTAKERLRTGQARVVSLTRQLDADRAEADAAARRTVLRLRQVAAASAVADALPGVLASIDSAVTDARQHLATAEAERAAQNTELRELRRTESELRTRLQSITENVHGLELAIYEKKLQVSALLERAASELGLVEDVLVGEYGPGQPVPVLGGPGAGAGAGADDSDQAPATGAAAGTPTTPYDRADQQARLAAAERKYARLGRINPLALEEFAALEQRHLFLTEQLTDLTTTRADLLGIIEDIDLKMGAIFSSAFDDTQAAFAEVFPVLFPGGSGSIFLTDPENMLSTGIDVTVKPAGKKIERLSLLSGGERSLAAVALLIAIFKARPSPFYIMDEVEAALDDANLGRLLTIFEDLRTTSQLIVITHQKRTMEIADALYGVSMRQDGVSAVVGQRIVREAEAV
ncbi:chromosome segregation protein SMC [Cryobacterium sp. 1639]|uniref:chromosome segregation protein SMC n=1 Tax=Cryobacterium inferilacus TaxID=2866629 RepID=UPI001C72CAC4|nr:chromosome segregation protein SMC [Cryobacterium sp. 1639]MBX0298688.1 chromosome segregation protein SMC [Cryobacterium sp. 1639]